MIIVVEKVVTEVEETKDREETDRIDVRRVRFQKMLLNTYEQNSG